MPANQIPRSMVRCSENFLVLLPLPDDSSSCLKVARKHRASYFENLYRYIGVSACGNGVGWGGDGWNGGSVADPEYGLANGPRGGAF